MNDSENAIFGERKEGREEALRRQALRTLNIKTEEGCETLTPIRLLVTLNKLYSQKNKMLFGQGLGINIISEAQQGTYLTDSSL